MCLTWVWSFVIRLPVTVQVVGGADHGACAEYRGVEMTPWDMAEQKGHAHVLQVLQVGIGHGMRDWSMVGGVEEDAGGQWRGLVDHSVRV